MTEWRECKLKELADFNPDSLTAKSKLQFINYLDTGNITKGKIDKIQYFNLLTDKVPSRAKRIVKKNDIIYSAVRPNQEHYGIIKNPVENMVVSTGFVVLRAKEDKCYSDFLYYFLTLPENTEYLSNVAEDSTTAYPSITPDIIMDMDISLPPLPEQIAIAEVLSSLDDKIDLLTRQNKTLEDLAQAYFRKWFIEDIHNKICYKRFADVAEFSKGKKPREIIEEQRKGYVRQILIDTFDTDKEYYTRPEGMIISTETDILMVMDGASSGRVEIGFSGVVGSTIGMFRPKSDFKYPMFLYEFLKSNEEFIMDNTTGSAIPHADKKLIFELEIPYFQEEKIQEFENFALVLFNKRQNNRRQIRTLTKLRDTLLPKLISGEIRVKM